MVKNPPANVGATGDADSIPGSGGSPGEGNGNSPHFSCQDNPWTDEPGGPQFTHGFTESDMTEQPSTHTRC